MRIFCLMLTWACALPASGLILGDDGRARFGVAVSQTAAEPERFAADELRRYVKILTGAALEPTGSAGFLRVALHLPLVDEQIRDCREDSVAKMEAWRCFQLSSEFVESKDSDAGLARRTQGATLGGSLTEQLETRARYYGSLIGVHYPETLKKSTYFPRAVLDINQLQRNGTVV